MWAGSALVAFGKIVHKFNENLGKWTGISCFVLGITVHSPLV